MSYLLIPADRGEKAYAIATQIFADMYNKVTHKEIACSDTDDGVSDLIFIGSDAVNDLLATLMLNGDVESLGIRYGTDDFAVKSTVVNGRNIIVLAGGRGRSTIYAVYDFFESLGCRYFWDGDVIPSLDEIDITNQNKLERPRFLYRGTRYFAHRGLKRFQAEHWSFDDFAKEIDWLLKKRLNFFMLRIGGDDLFQKAFPDDVSYPDSTRDETKTGYNDRTPFWPLEFRGDLRKKIMDYALSRDLMTASDCGTITHWYSPTPKEYLEKYKPSFLAQSRTFDDTAMVWDIRDQKNMDAYFKLTDAEVREWNGGSGLFHTIGLAERNMYDDRDKNLRLKLFTYRRIAQTLRQKYPDSKLLIAAWDFLGWWQSDEVKQLVSELDPERTIIFDYTSDGDDPERSFLNWDVKNKFPWIFGIFHAFEGENTLRGPYTRIEKRLAAAKDDDKCIGMVYWPELSHNDPLILEYLSKNAWAPQSKKFLQLVDDFCADRYGGCDDMNVVWKKALPVLELSYWGGFSKSGSPEYASESATHRPAWYNPARLALIFKSELALSHFKYKNEKYKEQQSAASDLLLQLLPLTDTKCAFVKRDITDIARTVLDLYMSAVFNKLCIDKEGRGERADQFSALFDCLIDILETSDDFSLSYTMQHINKVHPVPPSFEVTLKNNIEDRYCRQHCFELFKYVVKPECDIVMNWFKKPYDIDFNTAFCNVRDSFYKAPLDNMKRVAKKDALKTAIARSAKIIAELAL